MSTIIPEEVGTVGILNVGHGDTKLSFDPASPADCIRAARIVKDMLRRGYALLVEVVQPDGTKKFQRVYEFKDETYEYVIADLDPEVAAVADQQGAGDEQTAAASASADDTQGKPKRGRPRLRNIPASGSRGVAIARTAGG